MNAYANPHFAANILGLLPVVFVLALLAYSVKSRVVFVAGVCGSLAGLTIPPPRICVSGSFEGILMFHLHYAASNTLFWGTIGASVVIILVFAARLVRGQRFQFSIKTLLVLMTGIAILIASYEFVSH